MSQPLDQASPAHTPAVMEIIYHYLSDLCRDYHVEISDDARPGLSGADEDIVTAALTDEVARTAMHVPGQLNANYHHLQWVALYFGSKLHVDKSIEEYLSRDSDDFLWRYCQPAMEIIEEYTQNFPDRLKQLTQPLFGRLSDGTIFLNAPRSASTWNTMMANVAKDVSAAFVDILKALDQIKEALERFVISG
ncbi:hypothetical protein HD806DRAFT_545430 [Xylariaceae sp. AK1471]|nr:hypothetical protein HD806DRAFT_545430 [Xylariaceae sp. AK1471]